MILLHYNMFSQLKITESEVNMINKIMLSRSTMEDLKKARSIRKRIVLKYNEEIEQITEEIERRIKLCVVTKK